VAVIVLDRRISSSVDEEPDHLNLYSTRSRFFFAERFLYHLNVDNFVNRKRDRGVVTCTFSWWRLNLDDVSK
jgi:hypothetical protein